MSDLRLLRRCSATWEISGSYSSVLTTTPVLRGIEDGYVLGTMSQNPYGQAYLGSWVLDKLRNGSTVKPRAPFLIDTGTFLITADGQPVGPTESVSIADYAQKRVEITQQLLDSFEGNYLDCP